MEQERGSVCWTRALVLERLLERVEPEYGVFCKRLIPGDAKVLGVRKPFLHRLAKEISRGEWREWALSEDEEYQEEFLVKGYVLGLSKLPFKELEPLVRAYVPRIANWEVCDGFCGALKAAGEAPDQFWPLVRDYAESGEEYEIRFGIVMMLTYYLQPQYLSQLFSAFDRARKETYYVRMAVAWAVSMCYVRFPKETEGYLESCGLDDWTWNKSLQKIVESLRIDGKTREKIRQWKKNGRNVGEMPLEIR